jgi:hypothetical protein
MKTPALIIALLLSTAAAGAASADTNAVPGAKSQQQPTRLAGWFENDWDHEHHGERRHHGRHRDDDDDDDGGERHGGHAGRGGPADPNAANAPVPDNGVFNGKARPKVEVQ